MKKATFIKDLDRSGYSTSGIASVYQLDPPIEYTVWGDDCEVIPMTSEYVVVSAIIDSFSGPETYIFPSDAEGEISSWLELDGSFRGEMDLERALDKAGYEVTP